MLEGINVEFLSVILGDQRDMSEFIGLIQKLRKLIKEEEEDEEIVSCLPLVLSASKKLSIESPKQWGNSDMRSKNVKIKGELVSSEKTIHKMNSPIEDII